MNILNKAIIFFIILMTMLFGMLNLASAEIVVNRYSNDYVVSSPGNDLSVCQGSTYQDLVYVDNTGDFDTIFSMQVVSDFPPHLFTLDSPQFSLASKEKNTASIYTHIPFDHEGAIPYTIYITNSFGREKTIEKTFYAEKCQNIKASLHLQDRTILPCKDTTFMLEIENVANFPESYRLELPLYEEYLTPSETQFYLEPNQKKQIFIYFTAPCDVYGEFVIPFFIYSEGNRLEASIEQPLTIERKYDFSITYEDKVMTCERITTQIPFDINNLMHFNNDFEVAFDNLPDFAVPSKTQFSLEPESGEEFAIDVSPALGDEDSYTFTMTATELMSGIEAVQNIQFEAKECFKNEMEILLDFAEEYPESVVCPDALSARIHFRNDGIFTDNYRLEIIGPSWIKAEMTEFTLDPTEEIFINLMLYTPDDASENTVTFIITNVDHPEIVMEKTLTLQTLTHAQCRAITLEPKEVTVHYDTEVVPVIIRNDGIKPAVYNVNIESLFLTPDMTQVALLPGEEKVIHLTVEGVEAFVEGLYISTMSFMEIESNTEYLHTLDAYLKEKSWLQKTYEYFVYDVDYVAIGPCRYASLILLLACVVGILWLGFGRKRELPLGRNTLSVVILAAIVLIILSMVLFITAAPPDREYEDLGQTDYSALVHVWEQNHNYALDISQYFMDPDNDILRYESSQPAFIDVKIEDNTAILKPHYNFAGKQSIVFTAIDPEGAYADSPIITLKVASLKPVGVMGFWRTYCYQINLLLFILLLLIIIAIATGNINRRDTLDFIEELDRKFGTEEDSFQDEYIDVEEIDEIIESSRPKKKTVRKKTKKKVKKKKKAKKKKRAKKKKAKKKAKKKKVAKKKAKKKARKKKKKTKKKKSD